jgi:hypothetical protein
MSSLPIINQLLQGFAAKAELIHHVKDSCGHAAYLSQKDFDKMVDKVKKLVNQNCPGCCSCESLKALLKSFEEAPRGYGFCDETGKPKFVPKEEFQKEYEVFLAKFTPE